MSDDLIHAVAQMSKVDSEIYCHTCRHWTPSGAKPLLRPSYGECSKGISDCQSEKRTARDFGCIKHSALDEGGDS